MAGELNPNLGEAPVNYEIIKLTKKELQREADFQQLRWEWEKVMKIVLDKTLLLICTFVTL